MTGVPIPFFNHQSRETMKRIALTVVMFAVVMSVSFAGAADKLSEAEFQRLHRELQPAPDELWRSIPWKIELLDAQATAARDKKPIFIWAMDGHPLGCT